MSGSSSPPRPTGTARALDRGPSLRWRLRRWILKKLDAWPREKPEPTTEWGRLRRRERERLVQEVERLRALEDRLVRYMEYADASADAQDGIEDDSWSTPWRRGYAEAHEDVRHLVVCGHLDEMLAEFAEDGDELAAEYVREGSGA